ncbi:MAG: hypothetical protein ACR2J8_04245 [Thermomicrobiales bacterium]
MAIENQPKRARRWLWAVALVILVLVVMAVALAWSAGRVPGQPEVTRVPITPFADIPGFTAPTPVP